MMSKHHFRAASAGRPCDHHTDLHASWPLRFCLTPHNDKFEKDHKPVARRQITVPSYDPCTGPTVIVRTTQGFSFSFWPKNDRRLLR